MLRLTYYSGNYASIIYSSLVTGGASSSGTGHNPPGTDPLSPVTGGASSSGTGDSPPGTDPLSPVTGGASSSGTGDTNHCSKYEY